MNKMIKTLLFLLLSTTLLGQSITQPAPRSYELNTSGQDGSGFVLNGFGSTDVILCSIGFINQPAGTTFYITTTTGLTPATGFTLTGNKTRLVFTGTMANINTALSTLKVNTGGTTGSVQISVSATLNPTGYYYNPTNGHFYRPISIGATYTDAITLSSQQTFKGQQGYLVTITSNDEDLFIYNNVPQSNIWFAADDIATEGRWVISAGPEAGTVIRIGNAGGINQVGTYNNWASGEPNDYASNEDAAVTKWGGGFLWNDLGGFNTNAYVVEFGTWTNPANQTFTDFYSANVINPIKVATSKLNFYLGGNINPTQFSVKNFTNNGATAVSSTPAQSLGANGSVVNTPDFNKNVSQTIYVQPLTSTTLQNLYTSIVTVGDAYNAFQELANRGLSGTEIGQVFTSGVQFMNGDVDGNGVYDEKDSYKILQQVLGTAPIVQTWSNDNLMRLVDKSVFDGMTKGNWNTTAPPYRSNFPLTLPANTVDYVFNIMMAWKGDVNLSHTPTQNTPTTNSVNSMNRVVSTEISSYIETELVGGKLVTTIKVNPLGQKLKGVQFKINYDSEVLDFGEASFVTKGNPQNFANKQNGFVSVGSIITGMGELDENTEYRLIFSPKQIIKSGLGLITIQPIDAVNVDGAQLTIRSL